MWYLEHLFGGCVHGGEDVLGVLGQPHAGHKVHVQHHVVGRGHLGDGHIAQVVDGVVLLSITPGGNTQLHRVHIGELTVPHSPHELLVRFV